MRRGAYLAGGMHVVRHAMPCQRLHCAVVRVVANVICASPAAVKLLDQAFVWGLGGDGLEDALCHGRAADVAQADEQD